MMREALGTIPTWRGDSVGQVKYTEAAGASTAPTSYAFFMPSILARAYIGYYLLKTAYCCCFAAP